MEIEEKVESRAIPASDRRSSPRFAVDAEAKLLLVGHGLSMNCRCWTQPEGLPDADRGGIPAGIHVLVEVTFR